MKLLIGILLFLSINVYAEEYRGRTISQSRFGCNAKISDLRKVNRDGGVVSIYSSGGKIWPVFYFYDSAYAQYDYGNKEVCNKMAKCFNNFSGNQVSVDAYCRFNTLVLSASPLN